MIDWRSIKPLSWNMGDDGVVTIYARASETGPAFDVAYVFRRPMNLRHEMTEEHARCTNKQAGDLPMVGGPAPDALKPTRAGDE